MHTSFAIKFWFATLFSLCLMTAWLRSQPISQEPVTIETFKAQFFKLPLFFEQNQGQADDRVKFLSKGLEFTFFFTEQEITIVPVNEQNIHPTHFGLQFCGANSDVKLEGREEMSSKSHYLIGNDPQKWRTDIPHYAKVAYSEVYPGIDAIFYGNGEQIEYDLMIRPGADPQSIHLKVDGAKLSIDKEGNLHLLVSDGQELLMRKPIVYQMHQSKIGDLTAEFVILSENEIGFAVSPYDTDQLLVIDPILAYSTYFGGSGSDFGLGIAIDQQGNAYFTGKTSSPNFPTTSGAFQTTLAGTANAFVAKLNAAGSQRIYCSYLGGSATDEGTAIAIDNSLNAYITGSTSSKNFPITTGAFQTSLLGISNAFVTKLNAAGSALIYSTYLGGSGTDVGFGIGLDSQQNAYLTGSTTSSDFPLTPSPFQPSLNSPQNAFVTKLDSSGTFLTYSTYLGGNGTDAGLGIAVDTLDPINNAYVTGSTTSTNFPTTSGAFQTALKGSMDAFITKVNVDGSSLHYSSYLGGSGTDAGSGIVVDTSGNAFITGNTSSTDFPTTVGAFQTSLPNTLGNTSAFVTKFNASGTQLVYSTYLGGNDEEVGVGIAIDANGNAYIAGQTSSTNFPITAGAIQTSLGGTANAFFTKLNSAGSVPLYSTYLGGNAVDAGNGIKVDANGNAYIVGTTRSTNFPTTSGAFQTSLAGMRNAFVAKFAIGVPSVTGISPTSGPTFGGTTVTITGSTFTDATAVFFGAASAAFTVVNDNEIIATSPPHAAGTVDVTVMSPFGTSALSPADLFTYLLTPTITALSVAPNPSTFGQLVTLTAVVAPSSATGTVQFFDGGTLLATEPVSGGTATFSTTPFALGSHSLTAIYSGDSNFSGSTSNSVVLIVNNGTKATTTTTLSVSPNPATLGQLVTMTASIVSSSATGTVQFFDGATLLATVPVSGGTATFSINTLAIGTHSLTAIYSGNANFNGSTSNTVVLTINPAVFPPIKLKAIQKANRFATQTEYVTIVTWHTPRNGHVPVAYKIYRNKNLTELIGVVTKHEPLKFEEHNQKKEKKVTYFMVSVDQFGNISSPAAVTVRAENKS